MPGILMKKLASTKQKAWTIDFGCAPNHFHVFYGYEPADYEIIVSEKYARWLCTRYNCLKGFHEVLGRGMGQIEVNTHNFKSGL